MDCGGTVRQRMLDAIVIYPIFYMNPIAATFFRTAKLSRDAFFIGKVPEAIFYCRFSVSVPIPRTSGTDNRPTTILHLLQSIKNHPTPFHKIPCVFMKFVHNSQL